MFFPHLSFPIIGRREPDSLSISGSISKALRRNSELAEKIVYDSYLKSDKKSKQKMVREKILKLDEISERKRVAIDFMMIWNRWRKFYFDLSAIQPKTKTQLTSIENAIEIVKNQGISLTLYIACTHKEFVWRKVNPGFHDLSGKGMENYEKHHEDVIVDLDEANYKHGAMSG